MFTLYFILLLFPNVSTSKNILILQSVATKSYFNIFEGIAIILASEHNVTFISRFTLNEAHPNISLVQMAPHQLNLGSIYKHMYEIALRQDDTSEIGVNGVLFDESAYVDELMNDPAIKYIFDTRDLYDVLILPSVLSDVFIRFAHYLNVPLVQVATSYPLPWQNDAIQNINYISTDPSLVLFPHSENFYGRLTKFIQGMRLLHRYYYTFLPNMNKHSDKYFPPNTPKIEDASRNTSLLLVNTQETMRIAKPKVSNYVEIGGIHCRPTRALSSQLQKFLGNDDVIYMSLGLTINSTFPQHVLNSILKVFGKLPQKVIFKIDQDFDEVPKNVLILKSSPQQDILGLSNTKLFITQGGILSLQEAVYHQVPVLIIPLCLDQPSNAILANKLGYGRYLRLSQFSADKLMKEINELVYNEKYMEKVKEISALTKDVFRNSKDRLKWWINHIINNKKYLRNNTSKYSNYYIDVDIVIFLVLVIIFLLLLMLLSIMCIWQNIKTCTKLKKE